MTMSQAGFTCGVSARWATIRACRRRAAGALSRSDSRQRCSSSSSVASVVSVTSAVMLACAVAVSPARAQPAPASPVSSIRVTGDAKVTARPDRVQIDIGVSTRAAQSQEAAEQNARQVDAVLAAVRKATGAAVLKTSSYTLNPTYH